MYDYVDYTKVAGSSVNEPETLAHVIESAYDGTRCNHRANLKSNVDHARYTEKEKIPRPDEPETMFPNAFYDSIDSAGHSTRHKGANSRSTIDVGYGMECPGIHTLKVNHPASEVNYDEDTSTTGFHLVHPKGRTSGENGYSSNKVVVIPSIEYVMEWPRYARPRYTSEENNYLEPVCKIADVYSCLPGTTVGKDPESEASKC